MALRLEDLVARLGSGASIDSVLDELAPREHLDALDRCAALRTFDRATFEVACADLSAKARSAFDTVISHPEVELLDNGRYRVREDARRRRFDRWFADVGQSAVPSVPAWMRDLGVRLVAHFDAAATSDPREAMYHAFAVDAADGIARLGTLFTAAEQCFDLPACEDVLLLAQEREALGGPALTVELNRLRARKTTRARWSAEWYRTVDFVTPDASRDAADALLADEGPQVLQLVGEDGMGKTTHLQWLIARKCVPKGYACARLDLDDLGDPLLAAEEPWLLLLEIARQLDPQLADAPFRQLLLDHGGHCARLSWLAAGSQPAAVPTRAPESDEERRALVRNVRDRFDDALRSVSDERPVLIAVDSLEAALPPGRGKGRDRRLEALASTLAKIVEVPGVRIAVALPDDAGLPWPGADKKTARILALEPFTPKQAGDYLRDGWRLRLEPEIETAAIDAGGGIPMRLAALADVLKRSSEVKRADLETLAASDTTALAEFVIRGAGPELEELLRLGAAPRILDRGFFMSVLVPFVAQQPPGALEAHADHQALWRALRDFAGSSPWLDFAGDDGVRFHRLLDRPMRDLIRESAAGAALNRAAETFFLRRAEQEPDRWGTWVSEALFHRFMREGPRAMDFWRDLMRQADHREARHAERLAYEPLRPAGDLQRSVSEDGISEAWLRWAWANVRLAREARGAPRGHDGWERAHAALQELRLREGPSRSAQIVALEAALLARGGQEAAAVTMLGGALVTASEPADELELRVELARALEDARPTAAAREYRCAHELAARHAEARPDAVTIGGLLARHLADRDLAVAAAECCEETLARAESGTRTHSELLLLKAELRLATGSASAATALVAARGDAEDAMTGVRHEAGLLRARAAIATWQPEQAIRVLDRMLDGVLAEGARLNDADTELRIAEIRDLRGQARLRLADETGGLEDLESALLGYDAAGLSTRLQGCLGRIAEMQLRHLDDVRAAGFTLDRAEIAPRPAHPLESIGARLRRVEWLDRTRQSAGLHDQLRAVIADLRAVHARPRDLIAVAIEGLALRDDPDPAQYAALLTEQLALVESVGSRLVVVEELRRCRPLAGEHSEAVAGRLKKLTASPAGRGTRSPDLVDRDRGMLLLYEAEVARVFGRQDSARRRLAAARDAISADGMEPYARRRLLEALERFDVAGPAQAGDLGVAVTGEVIPATVEHPASNAALLIRGVSRLLGGDKVSLDQADALLRTAEGLLDPSRPEGKWLAALHDSLGDVAQKRGAAVEAQTHRQHATVLHDRLEERSGGVPTPGANPATAAGGVPLRIELRRRRAGLGVRRARTPRSEERLASGVVGEMLAKPDRRTVEEVVAWVSSDPDRWAAQAAAELFAPEVITRDQPPGQGPITLYLSSRDRRVHALPWELAADRAPRTIRTRLVRIERTTPGIHVEPAAPLDARTVALVNPARRRAREPAGRRTSSVQLDDRYRASRWEVEVIDSFAPDVLHDTITERAPAVVHITCPLVYMSGTAMLDIGGNGARPRGSRPEDELLTASRLARAAASSGGVFVLDPPGVAGIAETVRQLLLRNLLAAELLALSARPVLCTGLVRYGIHDDLAAKLVGSLTAGVDAWEAAATLRAAASTTDDRSPLRSATTTLFASSRQRAEP